MECFRKTTCGEKKSIKYSLITKEENKEVMKEMKKMEF